MDAPRLYWTSGLCVVIHNQQAGQHASVVAAAITLPTEEQRIGEQPVVFASLPGCTELFIGICGFMKNGRLCLCPKL